MLKKLSFILCIIFSWQQASAKIVDIQQWQLDNGAKVFYVYTPELPLLDVNLIFNAGSARDGTSYGLANFTAELASEGTKTLSADEIAENFADTGAIFGSSSSRDSSAFSLRTLIEKPLMEKALLTFSDIIKNPIFPEDSFARLQNQLLLGIEHQQQSPSVLANNTFYQLMYGDGPYGHPLIGNKQTVSSITTDAIRHFYQQYYVGNNATVVIVGDVEKKQALSIAKQIAGHLPKGKKPKTFAKETHQPTELIEHIPFPSSQTYIRMGDLAIDRHNPDYYALVVGNYILGGGTFVSRLFKEVREERGYSYHISSHFVPMKDPGPFVIVLQTRNDVAEKAMDLTYKIVNQFVEKGVTQAELDNAKKHMIDSFPGKIASNKDILANVSLIAFYDLPLDYLDTYQDNINKVTQKQIEKAFKRYVKPNQMITVTVGPEKQIPVDSQLTESVAKVVHW